MNESISFNIEIEDTEAFSVKDYILASFNFIFVSLGIIINIYFIIVTFRQKVILKWMKSISAINDLKLCVLLMPFLNLSYLLHSLAQIVIEQLGLYPESPRLCIAEYIITMLVSFLVVCGVFLIVRTGLQAALTENNNSNRIRMLLELGLLLVTFILIICLSIGFDWIIIYPYSDTYFGCYEDVILVYIMLTLHIVIIVFVLTSAIICLKRSIREDTNQSLIISLSSAIGFMYLIFWFPYELFNIYSIISERLIGDVWHSMVYILIFIRFGSCIFYPFLCLRNKYQFFVNDTEEFFVNTNEAMTLFDIKT